MCGALLLLRLKKTEIRFKCLYFVISKHAGKFFSNVTPQVQADINECF